MTRFTDGTKLLDIEMKVWNGNGYDPSFEADFFDCGSLPYDNNLDASKVDDVDYLVDAAIAWSEGKYNEWDTNCEDDPTEEEIENRCVIHEIHFLW